MKHSGGVQGLLRAQVQGLRPDGPSRLTRVESSVHTTQTPPHRPSPPRDFFFHIRVEAGLGPRGIQCTAEDIVQRQQRQVVDGRFTRTPARLRVRLRPCEGARRVGQPRQGARRRAALSCMRLRYRYRQGVRRRRGCRRQLEHGQTCLGSSLPSSAGWYGWRKTEEVSAHVKASCPIRTIDLDLGDHGVSSGCLG